MSKLVKVFLFLILIELYTFLFPIYTPYVGVCVDDMIALKRHAVEQYWRYYEAQ